MRAIRPVVILITVLLAITLAWTALAHEVGLSRGDYLVDGREVTATLVFSARDVAFAGGPSKLSPTISSGAPCATRVVETASVEEDGVRIVVHATCPTSNEITIDATFLGALPFGHRHLASVPSSDGAVEHALTISRRSLTFSSPARDSIPSMLSMGVEHILTGYDHLVFLLGLVIVSTKLRELAITVTAFTLGHSISLALATLSVWTPSARIVEPLIALSIVYVGVENIARKRQTRRWSLTLPFGVVHGFGFASALRELSLPRAELPRALALFNLGVELGQLGVIALLLPVVVHIAKRETLHRRVVRWTSAAIAVAGIVWFAARISDVH